MINKRLRSPFKKDFGKEIHEEQRKNLSYREGTLKRIIKKKGRV